MVARTVDLRSDTVTKPTAAMRAAMANAEVADDVLDYDPTALRLETEMAKVTGKEAALFVPSGTMGNLVSVLVHCNIRGSEVILGSNSHIHIYENGGISTIGGVHPRTVKNNDDGTMDVDLIEAAIRDPRGEIVYPTTRLICLENTQANLSERQLLPPIELTLKQMDTAGTELECFQALRRQEQLAASHRINGLWEEVQKQKELEQTLQRRYGDLVAELERTQQLIINYRALAIQQEEIAAKNRTLELAEAATKQAAMLNSEPSEPVTSDEHGNSMPVGSSDKKFSDEGQMTLVQGNGHEASGAIPSSPDGNNQNGAPVLTEDSISRGDIISTVGVAVKIKVNDASVEGESIQERADGFDKADVIQVSNGRDDKVNQMKDEGKLPVIDVDLTDSE